MKLSSQAEAMHAGEMGPARRWALQHQVQVGRMFDAVDMVEVSQAHICLLYTSPSPRDRTRSRMPSSA